MGEHHKELLHEVCDLIDDSECDVLHADVDRDAKGIEVCIFYILHKLTGAIQSDERQALKVRAQQASSKNTTLSQQSSLTSRHTYNRTSSMPSTRCTEWRVMSQSTWASRARQ